MKNTAAQILTQYQLRHTACRVAILDLFLAQSFALAQADIEKNLDTEYDRVTVYRTLRSFLDKGVLHKVLDSNSTPKFALCTSTCTSQTHNHQHLHFKCEMCNQTTCLDKLGVPALTLPEGYQIQEINVLVQGVCKSCATQAVV